MEPARLQIVLAQTNEPPPLLPRHRVARPFAPVRAPALDLDEHHDVVVAADEIDLALAKAHVALPHGEPGAREPACRRLLRGLTDRSPLIAHAFRIRRRPGRARVDKAIRLD